MDSGIPKRWLSVTRRLSRSIKVGRGGMLASSGSDGAAVSGSAGGLGEDAGGLVLLQTACECADLEADAMAQARSEGLSSVDRYGQRRPHPLLSVARDARGQMLAALRQLHLDVEPLRDRPGRPAGR